MGALSFLQPKTGCSLLFVDLLLARQGEGKQWGQGYQARKVFLFRRTWPSSGERHPSTTSKPN